MAKKLQTALEASEAVAIEAEGTKKNIRFLLPTLQQVEVEVEVEVEVAVLALITM